MKDYRITDAFVELLKAEGIANKDFADLLATTPQALSSKIKYDALGAHEWVHWADLIGYDIILVKRADKKPFRPRKGDAMPRTVSMINGITYDTKAASFVCEWEFEDGFHERMYVSDDGRWFLVLLAPEGDDRRIVVRITEAMAKGYYALHGEGDCDHFFEPDAFSFPEVSPEK
jgi:hypothetical protein